MIQENIIRGKGKGEQKYEFNLHQDSKGNKQKSNFVVAYVFFLHWSDKFGKDGSC